MPKLPRRCNDVIGLTSALHEQPLLLTILFDAPDAILYSVTIEALVFTHRLWASSGSEAMAASIRAFAGAMFRSSIVALLAVLGQATQHPASLLLDGVDGKVTVLLQRQLMQLIVHRRRRCRFLRRLFHRRIRADHRRNKRYPIPLFPIQPGKKRQIARSHPL